MPRRGTMNQLPKEKNAEERRVREGKTMAKSEQIEV